MPVAPIDAAPPTSSNGCAASCTFACSFDTHAHRAPEATRAPEQDNVDDPADYFQDADAAANTRVELAASSVLVDGNDDAVDDAAETTAAATAAAAAVVAVSEARDEFEAPVVPVNGASRVACVSRVAVDSRMRANFQASTSCSSSRASGSARRRSASTL